MLWDHHMFNKANLRDLIAVTGLVMLLKFYPNHQFFSLEIGWITSTSSFVHHIKSCGEFKLKLQSGNAQFGSKSAIFCPVWPWNLMQDLGKTKQHLFYTTSSFVHHFKAMGEFKMELQSRNSQFRSKSAIFLVPRDLEIWWMTLKNNMAPLLCCFKLFASFHSHQWIQTRVTVRKCPIWVKIAVFCPVWPWNFTNDIEKQQGTSSMLLQALCIIL